MSYTRYFAHYIPEAVGVAPTVQTLEATLVTANSARLWGKITDDGGEACEYRFRYYKAGHSVLIDPIEDGFIFLLAGEYLRNNTGDTIETGRVGTEIERGYVEWDISSIPDSATIIKVVLRYHGEYHTIDCHIHEMLGARPSISGDQAVYDEAGEGTVYADPADFPVVAANQQVDLGASAASDLQSQLSSDWFAIGIQSDSEATPATSAIYSEEYTSADPKPILYVEYGEAYIYTPWADGKVTDETFFEDIANLDPSSTYYFAAQARNSAGESEWGDEVDFDTLSAIIETIIAKEFPMGYYQTAGVKELRSKVSGATVTKVANDFPPLLQKEGKAKELVSKWS